MKTIILIFTATLLTACAAPHQINVVREAVDTGRIQGMDKETEFSYSFGIPYGATHPGPYSSVDDIKVKVETGKFMGKNAIFFLGKSRATGQWEIFSAMVEEEGKWRSIPLRSDGKE
ncbi:MAG: hypothetical protein V1766_08600 [Pseudomonadota bacterium]